MTQHRPRKRFGQHFLHDAAIIERIIAAIDPKPGQLFVEIGPGKGALTLPLLQRLGMMHVVELDRDLASIIIDRCQGRGELHMHCMDALTFNFCGISGSQLRVVGNLPYNITTPLIFHLLDYLHCIKDMLFMLQKEVVERLNAIPGNKTYGRLSVMIQSRCSVEKLFTVGAGAFTPLPKVESAIVRLIPHEMPVAEIVNNDIFASIVKQSFMHRRKTLRNTLKDMLSEKQIQMLGIDPGNRAEQLSINDFAALANFYHNYKNQ
ncbi:MAG: 16S rRNA (adenine(1518)-N(6)/adenine(1519)-N(6))-dimethyltransferase RsmA [Gammaproteobacteria bacterium]|nr:16S rRNA (adenine(1518)-N(6)/adenine(1519)-N(6))-dimethyltransferase RsmA [Gammaproteobacteria bacterium]